MKDKIEYTNTYDWLIKNGFDDTDILNIKKIYDREGVKFCKRSFNINDFKDMKIELNKIKKKEQKDLKTSEDDLKKSLNEIQKITDLNIDKIDKILESKKNDILKV